ncbi:MAG: dihydroneopterin aldolase [Armatimonadetes bacterium 55-13]|nr:MAG: dihydroneopterin aldolase [Armatimonadetes bacterium 55-13]
MPSTFTVFVRGIEFYGFHGVPAEERVIGHRYRVDIEMKVAGDADTSDLIEDTVDYGAISVLIARMGQEVKVLTVERLARMMAERLLDGYPTIQDINIRIAKPFPPAPVIALEAGVELRVTR